MTYIHNNVCTQIHTNTTHACPRVTHACIRCTVVSQSHENYITVAIVLLTKSVIRVGEEESVQRQEEEEDQVRDQVEQEDGSPIRPPFVLQQTRHHWVSQQVITFALHLQQRNRSDITTDVDPIAIIADTYFMFLNITDIPSYFDILVYFRLNVLKPCWPEICVPLSSCRYCSCTFIIIYKYLGIH